jgi:hypothetical protein
LEKDVSIFNKSYQLEEGCPKSIEWEEYVKNVASEYLELLKNHSDSEETFQDFLERHPSMVPGAFGLFGESGHSPYNNALITQPKLNGLTTKIPDFLWIASDSGTVYPVFIEIETPKKKWFNGKGNTSADFTHAQTQLADWKVWFSNPNHQNLFFQYYDIDIFIKGKSVCPQYVLIYGSNKEFKEKPESNMKRSQLTKDNEVYMTFNRLFPNYKAKNTLTCNVTDGKYLAKYIPQTFRLGPVYAEEMSKIEGKEDAIKRSSIPKERKNFLISRLEYWDNFAKDRSLGIINTGDWE